MSKSQIFKFEVHLNELAGVLFLTHGVTSVYVGLQQTLPESGDSLFSSIFCVKLKINLFRLADAGYYSLSVNETNSDSFCVNA